ncbi:Lipoprotein NlpD [Methylophaga lonarensis MPL]|uniref:Lipoprotein NlpD n=1 Tax=Methylophaga lonarensis MPL TaxID=1286106 RepID=M7P333_9GAMM|nr:peptidoglycan DD-metalloendopeptidase family protein [Methylophaga lonarensis]EMR13912.1 Lipoprotein NlpD [Methylophaga lonarensis MPL]
MMRVWPVLLLSILTACSSSTMAPVGHQGSAAQQVRGPAPQTPPNYYTVVRGDTLYSISFRYGMDYRDVARMNGIRPPYTIYVGQRIYFRPGAAPSSPSVQTARPAQAPTQTQQQRPAQQPAQTQQQQQQAAVRPAPAPQTSAPASSTATTQNLTWRWPTQGTVISTFSETAQGKKGISIAGRAGQPVLAAADGKVVYSGAGMPRYGNLLIIKHNDVYLSAYAHNDTMMVAEGATVRAGQQIATLGRTGTQRDQLHFEIRRNGKPVDPLRFLPKQ